MKCNRSTAFVALALVALLGLVGHVAAKDKGKDKDKDQVPFRGCLEGDVTRSGAPPIVSVNVDAEGHATHLGHFELSIPHTVNVVTRTATGSYLFVAANGDTLTATFTGASMPLAADPTVLDIVENATITGGTGRFAGATRSFVCERLYDTVAGTTSGCFEGTISKPDKEKDKCGR